MQKIPTIFVRDETRRGHPVIDQVKLECQWVLDGEGVPTVKLDGTNVKVEGGQLYKRQKPKDRDYDAASYVPCDRSDPADRYLWEAFEEPGTQHIDGIYEAIGPKIQGGAGAVGRAINGHIMIPIAPIATTVRDDAFPGYNLALALDATVTDRSFVGLRDFLACHRFEGLVFHHPDGRMAKIKRRDFGLPWPVK